MRVPETTLEPVGGFAVIEVIICNGFTELRDSGSLLTSWKVPFDLTICIVISAIYDFPLNVIYVLNHARVVLYLSLVAIHEYVLHLQ